MPEVTQHESFHKLARIMGEQNNLFIDREAAIRVTWTALLCKEHLFLLGRPGIAKSMLLEDTARRITDSKLFLYLMTKTSMPAELFGPVSLTALKNDKLHYNTAGFLPEANFSMLDELFKASSAILNSLLRVVNEREFINGGTAVKVPLMSLFAASNELPEGAELQALYDRLLFRLELKDLELDSDFRKLLETEPNLSGEYSSIGMDELEDMQRAVAAMPVPSAVLDTLTTIRSRMHIEGMRPSSRRWLKGLKAVRANAFLKGREVIADDLLVYRNILWNTPEEEHKVGKVVLQTVSPLADKVLDLIDQAIQLHTELKKIKSGQHERLRPNDGPSVIAEFQTKLKNIRNDLKGLRDGSNSDLVREEAGRGVKIAQDATTYMAREFMDLDEDTMAVAMGRN